MRGAYCITYYACCIVPRGSPEKGEAMKEQERRDNLLGAFVLSVSDRLRRETEESIGHTGASAAALITITQFPGRSIEFLRQAIGLSHPATVRVVDRLVEQGLVRRRPGGGGPAGAVWGAPPRPHPARRAPPR